MSETTAPKATKAPIVASDGRTIEDFKDLEARRVELAGLFGKRNFSRAVVGEAMGVPGPTIMRIERVTAKTTAVELEALESTLDRLEAEAHEAADLAGAERGDVDEEADDDE